MFRHDHYRNYLLWMETLSPAFSDCRAVMRDHPLRLLGNRGAEYQNTFSLALSGGASMAISSPWESLRREFPRHATSLSPPLLPAAALSSNSFLRTASWPCRKRAVPPVVRRAWERHLLPAFSVPAP